MKKEINQKDIDKILTLKNMTENICNLIKEEDKYIEYLFKHFQEDKYYYTNFFIEGTTENSLYNYLDYLDRCFNASYGGLFFKLIGSLDYYLSEFENQKKNKKEQKNNENN